MIETKHLSKAAQVMFDRVCSHRHVSMVELERCYESVHGEETAYGDLWMWIGVPNMYIWYMVSEGFVDAFDEIKPLVDIEATVPFVYFIDGGKFIPSLPIAKRPPKNGYKKPHWCPVVLNPKEST